MRKVIKKNMFYYNLIVKIKRVNEKGRNLEKASRKIVPQFFFLNIINIFF